MNICPQKSASIEPRTSPSKFALAAAVHFAAAAAAGAAGCRGAASPLGAEANFYILSHSAPPKDTEMGTVRCTARSGTLNEYAASCFQTLERDVIMAARHIKCHRRSSTRATA